MAAAAPRAPARLIWPNVPEAALSAVLSAGVVPPEVLAGGGEVVVGVVGRGGGVEVVVVEVVVVVEEVVVVVVVPEVVVVVLVVVVVVEEPGAGGVDPDEVVAVKHDWSVPCWTGKAADWTSAPVLSRRLMPINWGALGGNLTCQVKEVPLGIWPKSTRAAAVGWLPGRMLKK
jgi:hypothetical protein